MEDKINRENTNEITCPYCGYKIGDSWEYNSEEEGEINCSGCSRKFNFSVNITVDYSTSKINCEELEQKEGHEYKTERYYKYTKDYKNGEWITLPEDDYKYYRIEICTKCDNVNYIDITKEEFDNTPISLKQ